MPIKVLANDTAILANNDIDEQQALTVDTEGHEASKNDVSAISKENCPSTIAQKHWEEWTQGSGISPEITKSCLQSLNDHREIVKIVEWNGYPDDLPLGWVAHGISLVTLNPLKPCQFKPDIPVRLKAEDKDPARYITGKTYDALVLPVRDWAEIKEDPSHPVTLTEGPKKTGALETCGYAALGLAGVEMGLKDDRLVPNLEAIAVKGRPFYICFDADLAANEKVQNALIKLAIVLKRKGCLVYVIPAWDISLGKGIDDVLANHGPEQVHKTMGTPIPYKKWLKGLEQQFKPVKSPKQRITPADLIARDIADECRSQLAFNNESGLWMRYEADSPGVWSSESPEFIESLVYQVLTSKGISGFGGNAYVTNIVKILRHQLICRKWIERSPSELIPFKNGALEVATGKLLPHSPSYRFTWAMPREHNILAQDWNTIDKFLTEATDNNPKIKKLLLCFCNAVLKGRSDLQKFLHFTGPGGTGKGTFMRLLTDLIGQNNTHTSTLEDWCGNRFEAANAYKKRLIVFPDEDKKVGSLGRFKSLTGEDFLRAEEKGQKAFQFKYDGMVVLSSNFPIFQGDNSSGLTRRTILVPFNHVPLARDRRNLNQEFEPELSAFINYLLSIPDEVVTATLMGTSDIAELSQEFWTNQQRTNSIAAWLNDCVIYDPLASTPIGNDKNEGDNGNPPGTLFGSYCAHAKKIGMQPKSLNNFSPDLLELCNNILKWTIQKQQKRTGNFIQGLRLRSSGDDDIPTYEALLAQTVEDSKPVIEKLGGDQRGGSVETCVEAETLTKQESGGCGDLSSLLIDNKKIEKNEDKIDKVEISTDVINTTQSLLASTPSTSLTEQTIEPPHSPPPYSPQKPPQAKVDFTSFPHLTSNDYRAKEKRATQIKESILICSNKEELTSFKAESGYNEAEIQWVYENVLTELEQEQMKIASTIFQPSLFQTDAIADDACTSGQWKEPPEGMDLLPEQIIKDKVTNLKCKIKGYNTKSNRYDVCYADGSQGGIPLKDILVWVES
ncbi:MAG: phage/plasmid primase, P4 family [Snowella sp.]|nr:phage/plasmid primase, P4 family [Snowella sp.]